jgi:DNA-binding SARP family transcriptional activator
MAVLDLRLLGGFEARTGSGKPIALPGRKSAALLAYLALHADGPVQRDKLAALLWGTKSQAAARANLRQTLTALRKSLPGECLTALTVSGETLTAHSGAIVLDVASFDQVDTAAVDCRGGKNTAVYGGHLLDGLDIKEPAFDEWLREARDNLRQRALGKFSRALERLEARGDTAGAIDAAKSLLALEPLDESVHRRLMRL